MQRGSIISNYEPLEMSWENVPHGIDLCAKCQAGSICVQTNNRQKYNQYDGYQYDDHQYDDHQYNDHQYDDQYDDHQYDDQYDDHKDGNVICSFVTSNSDLYII